ncbi:PadR family transcriptional regulator [Actinomadura algeriensis]|uniref:DNA-binding PadR family transcriptional regulator n=1 Tax=Actinomadura algeriensis TaxID=1679523 RepID=A0ABR9JSG9_9ACTN|nr:PadR family transcriptional regulator [Actinomadura algeriensis]MBE1533511.1 DNA-binding PadR family transcriptional regulator [Actinomadura algeriensis]
MHAHHMRGRPGPFQRPEERARRGGPFGPGGPGGPGAFGPGGLGPWGHGHRGGGRGRGGRRTRRGNVRAALLALLAERSMHGYEMIQELDERTGGVWRPSPGSVYPTLQMLEDEGLVTSREDGGKRLFSLTDTGREEASKQTTAPWEEVTDAAGESALRGREAVGQLMGALQQVMAVGSETQKARALDVVNDARRRIYGILADDPEAE